MNAAPLTSDFTTATTGQGLRADRVLNYVWIAQAPRKPPSILLCTMPLHYFDTAFENARRYPDTPVKLWFDLDNLDAMSRFFVASYIHLHAPSNVSTHELSDIPDYKKDKLFKPDLNFGIWARVDVARLMVTSHCFEESDVQQVFYSDFDIPDVKLEGVETQLALKNSGMSFGFTRDDDIENSYIVFSRERAGALQQLIKETLREIARGRTDNGYEPLHDFAVLQTDGDLKRLKASVCVPDTGFVLPPTRHFRDLQISPWGHRC